MICVKKKFAHPPPATPVLLTAETMGLSYQTAYTLYDVERQPTSASRRDTSVEEHETGASNLISHIWSGLWRPSPAADITRKPTCCEKTLEIEMSHSGFFLSPTSVFVWVVL
jgi:hypothetical protein